MSRSVGWLALLVVGCTAAGASDDVWVPVVRGDLTLEVDVIGTLKAVRSAPLTVPSGADDEDMRIARMAPEGKEVKKGEKVLFFDASGFEREQVERTAERDSAMKEVERKAHEIELDRKQGELRVQEAEAAARKARLKADLPEKYTAAVEVRLAKIDLDAAEAELRMAKQRLEHSIKLGKAELAYLRDRATRFQRRAARLEETISMLAVPTPIPGVVVYRTNWRGEKKKVGDPCWFGEACIEVVDTAEMEAWGEIDEMESARVAVGQSARLRLEALPETEWRGQVVALRSNVYRQSPRTPLKVIGAQIKLEKTDSTRMRPGMQFRGKLETGRLAGVVLVPVDAVFNRPTGPVAFRRTTTGWEKVPLELGRRNATQVEVKRGLNAGDRVSRDDLEEGGT